MTQLVEKMNDLLRHRGPDDEAAWSLRQAGVFLGHRRLSILDVSPRGRQPMVAPDGTAIVFNGEVYNFRELKRSLPEYPFYSDTDTELVLALYQEKGERCLDELTGMFAFAIWDPEKNGLFLARDRIGKKPLYYHTSESGRFAFSSEIRALACLPWISSEIDRKAFYYFLTFGFTPAPMTMFKGIAKLDPGTAMWVGSNGAESPRPYWKARLYETADSEEALVAALMERLERSVDLRMVSDVPVGVFLSGGVDSTGMATLMRKRTNAPIRSFSISFAGEPAYDEAGLARATAERLGLDHHERVVTRADMREMIETIAGVLDEPLADPTCVPLYFLSEMARSFDTKVVLTGDGPDELLLGYRNWSRYRRAYPLFRAYGRLPRWVRQAGLGLVRWAASSARLIEMFHRASLGQELFWGSAPSFRESEKQGLLSAGLAERAREWDCHDEIATLRAEYDLLVRDGGPGNGDANWMAYVGLRFNIPNFYLHRADRLGMCHSVELRAPYLDHDFATLALSIPAKWKVKGGEPKYILKRAFQGLVPDEVLRRAKRGFCVPMREWGGDVMTDGIMGGMDVITSGSGLLSRKAIETQVIRFRNGDASLTRNMWNLYFLIAWMQRWMP